MIQKRARSKITSDPYDTILKDWLSRCKQNKTKTVAPHITNLMCSLQLLLTISFQLVRRYGKSLPTSLVFASFWKLQAYGNYAKKFSRI